MISRPELKSKEMPTNRNEHSLVVLRLVHLEQGRENMINKLLDTGVQRDLNSLTRNPLDGVTELVERTTNLEE